MGVREKAVVECAAKVARVEGVVTQCRRKVGGGVILSSAFINIVVFNRHDIELQEKRNKKNDIVLA
jgi:hypothetical protein